MRKTWAAQSARKASLPKDWWRIRWQVLERDHHRCQIRIPDRCIGVANQVDHAGDRNDHRPENMRAACGPCHAHRSANQGGVAAGKARAARVAARKRIPERHPGSLGP
jgi:5-methylcytosine-specific restriction protein A